MQKIIFASNNQHKLSEIRKLAEGLPVQIVSLKEVGWTEEIPEDYDTFEQNAQQKAMTIFQQTGLPCFSDDSGLEVEALNGLPGVHSARFYLSKYPDIPPHERDYYNNLLLLELLQHSTNRNARFRTVICYVEEGSPHFFEGEVRGTIANAPAGINGFGYDPLFIPEGYAITFAQMTQQQKNTLSHRSRAMAKFMDYLKNKNL
ncbi:MAG: RdgB/HAM1 family non-canonical purine NTP pyrophosphatase [Bacteroidales bacterium]